MESRKEISPLNYSHFVVCALFVGVIFIVCDGLVALLTMPFMPEIEDVAAWKDEPNIIAGMIFDLINGFILIGVYHIIRQGIPGEGWKKGFYYGCIVGLFRVVMLTFTTIVVYDVSFEVVLIQLVAYYIEIVVLGIVTVLLYHRLGVPK